MSAGPLYFGLRFWLAGYGYRAQSIDTTIKAAHQLVRWTDEGRAAELPSRLRGPLKRVADYLGKRSESEERLVRYLPELEEFLERTAPSEDSRARRMTKRGRRKSVARSFDDGEWQALVRAFERDPEDEAVVLAIIAATGLRVGDVLGLERRALILPGDAFEARRVHERILLSTKGGKERTLLSSGAAAQWDRLARRWEGGHNVAAFLTGGLDDVTASGAAYKRLARALVRLAAEAGITSRAYLHRMRRTVGVQALRVTEDVTAVQQLLGHESSMTTLGYLDEARPDRVATLQRQIQDRFTGGKKP